MLFDSQHTAAKMRLWAKLLYHFGIPSSISSRLSSIGLVSIASWDRTWP